MSWMRKLCVKVLRSNKDLFYKEGSKDIRCSNQIKHEINAGDARPVRKQPYRLVHPLEPIVEEQGNEMFGKKRELLQKTLHRGTIQA